MTEQYPVFMALQRYMDDQKYGNTIKQYQKLFVFVFKYLFFLLAILVALLSFKKIFTTPTDLSNGTDPYSIQKIKLVGTFEKSFKQAPPEPNLQIHILQ